MLRGAVAALLAHHVVLLVLPGPRPVVRGTLAVFAASVLAYVFCQQAGMLLNMLRPLAWLLLALCVTSTAWLWMAARALFDDGFALRGWMIAAIVAMLGLGLAANLPYFPADDGPYRVFAPDSAVARLGQLHAMAMLGFTAAAVWEVGRGWRDDLVASRRAARRWIAMGIVLYAALALAIELALRGAPVGRLLPSLHIAVIGALSLALSLTVARGSLEAVLGYSGHTHGDQANSQVPALPAPSVAPDAPVASASPGTPNSPALPATPVSSAAINREFRDTRLLARLDDAMTREHAYRRERLSLAGLARMLDSAEAPLRDLINQRLGFRNFNDFLHHHRLQEAAARLAAEDLPILTIALECGYGSIGPFNRAFRQRHGVTPTEYRAAARIARNSG